jgi:hypothetical protein
MLCFFAFLSSLYGMSNYVFRVIGNERPLTA